jgi:hypothetical protein
MRRARAASAWGAHARDPVATDVGTAIMRPLPRLQNILGFFKPRSLARRKANLT